MTSIKFAHLADCHLGAWRDPKLRALNLQCFSDAIETILSEKVSFVIIAGDLFNTAIPSIDVIKFATEKLKKLADADIKVYGIAGSHDYSAAGKSMLEVLEKADLFENVMKGTITENAVMLKPIIDKTGITITGILGKRGTLESKYYESLDIESLEKISAPKIFVFHSGLQEITPDMSNTSISFLPKGFDYYAGGHVHIRSSEVIAEYGRITYPGPVFPNSFSELEELQGGSFVLVEDMKPKFIDLCPKKIYKIVVHHDGTPEEIEEEILKHTAVHDALVLIRVSGKTTGTIDFSKIYEALYQRGAYSILRNTANLNLPAVKIQEKEITDIADVEKEVTAENIEHSFLKKADGTELSEDAQKSIVETYMKVLATDKLDGETVADFEERVYAEFMKHGSA
jgi:exonuclease SbcD